MDRGMPVYFSAIGQDSHRFESASSSKPLMLGGVPIPDTPALAGNSDADVILHALCNAISGLSGVNVLGTRTDQLCSERGITDSRIYVREALATLSDIRLVHVSISVEAHRPHLQRYGEAIRQSIAGLLQLPVEQVGLTATSGEGLTSFGRGEGIQALVIASAYRLIAEK
jgi:2-C-methyl-D-erythritol 2,4-cyclodiphosphate synthase